MFYRAKKLLWPSIPNPENSNAVQKIEMTYEMVSMGQRNDKIILWYFIVMKIYLQKVTLIKYVIIHVHVHIYKYYIQIITYLYMYKYELFIQKYLKTGLYIKKERFFRILFMLIFLFLLINFLFSADIFF